MARRLPTLPNIVMLNPDEGVAKHPLEVRTTEVVRTVRSTTLMGLSYE